ncbi:MAG: hypothetical protein ACXV5H_11600 [Halobacteriota archaeon]
MSDILKGLEGLEVVITTMVGESKITGTVLRADKAGILLQWDRVRDLRRVRFVPYNNIWSMDIWGMDIKKHRDEADAV